MKTLISILVIVGAFAGFRYMAGAVVTNEQVRQVNNRASDPKSESVVERAVFYKEFMAGCDDGTLDGAKFDQTTYCNCAFDSMEEKYGLNYMTQSALNDSEEQMLAKFNAEFEGCLKQQGVILET